LKLEWMVQNGRFDPRLRWKMTAVVTFDQR